MKSQSQIQILQLWLLVLQKCTAPQTAVISDQTEGFCRGWSNNQNNLIDVNWIYASFNIEESYLRNLLLLCFKPSVCMTLVCYFPDNQLLFLALRPYFFVVWISCHFRWQSKGNMQQVIGNQLRFIKCVFKICVHLSSEVEFIISNLSEYLASVLGRIFYWV